jgi:hypothetical protein
LKSGGKPISREVLQEYMSSKKEGDPVSFKVKRAGAVVDVSGKAPAGMAPAAAAHRLIPEAPPDPVPASRRSEFMKLTTMLAPIGLVLLASCATPTGRLRIGSASS